MSLANSPKAVQLRTAYTTFLEKNPKARIRNVAQALNTSELELVAASAGGLQSTPLKGPAQEIVKELGNLGSVMALSRNDWAVHERHGKYENIRVTQSMGLVLGPDIDLRLFFKNWGEIWAVNDQGRHSLQFFDKAGTAIHKVFCTEDTDLVAYENLVKKFTNSETVWPTLQAISQNTPPQNTVDPSELRQRWLAMTDTHQFHNILQELDISRLTALHHAGSDLAQLVDNTTIESMLEAVVAQQIPFMCFVGNSGIVQIHSGPIEHVLRTGPWFNILDPHFNLHLDTTAIAETWLVNRPSSDGWITSLECYTTNGDLITQFFGARKPGLPELSTWRQLLSSYATQALAA